MYTPDVSERPKIVFPHIMKTAGTTLNQWIERHYHRDEVLWEAAVWQELFDIPAAILEQKRFVRGHFGAHITRLFRKEQGFAPIALLRNPVERTLSHFWHLKRAPDGNPAFSFARDDSFTLERFLEDERTRVYASNYQTANLSVPTLPAGGAATLSNGRSDGTFNTVETSPLDPVAARAFIDRCEVVGVCEDLDGFIDDLSSRFGFWPDHLMGRSRSYRNSADEVSGDVRRRIKMLNEADEDLYQHAIRRIHERRAARTGRVFPAKNPLDATRTGKAVFQVDAPFWGEEWSDVQLHRADGVQIGHRWSLSPSSSLIFKVTSGVNYSMVFSVFRFVAPFQVKDFHLTCNGARRDVHYVAPDETGSGKGIFLAPLGTANSDTLRVEFRINEMISFNDVNQADPDTQKKGLALSWTTVVADTSEIRRP